MQWLNLILPPRCFVCGEEVAAQGMQCAACWSGLSFIRGAMCAGCGAPFDYDMGADAVCADCAGNRFLFDRGRSVFRYDDASRNMVLAFKHGDRHEGVAAFGQWMAQVVEPWLDEVEVIVPVPLHWSRLFKRRFNQSAMLAQALSRQTGLPILPDVLRRHKRTSSQAGLGATGRRRNVATAFSIKPQDKPKIKDLRVLLVDDVFTTGATLNACTRVLKRYGAIDVSIVTLARVVNS